MAARKATEEESEVFQDYITDLVTAVGPHTKNLLLKFYKERLITAEIRNRDDAGEAIKAIEASINTGAPTAFAKFMKVLKTNPGTKHIAENMEKALDDRLSKLNRQTSPQNLSSKSQDIPVSSQSPLPAQQVPFPHTPSDQSPGLGNVGIQERPMDPRLMDGKKLKVGFLSQYPGLIKRLDTEALLPYLVAEGLITHDDSDSIPLEGVGSKKTDKLLTVIHRRGFGNPSVYVRFLQLLSDEVITAGQLLESLVEDIKNDSLNDSIAQKFSNQADVSLQVHKGTIAASLNVDEVLHDLVAEGVVTILEKKKINAKKTATAKAEQLVDSIQAGGSRAFEVFVKVLSSLQSHEHLARLLESPELAANGDDEKNGMYVDSPGSSQAPQPAQQDPLLYTPSDPSRGLGDFEIQGQGTTAQASKQRYAKNVSAFSEQASSHEGSQILVPGSKASVPPTAGSYLTKPELQDLIRKTVTDMKITEPVEQNDEKHKEQIKKLENLIAEIDSAQQDPLPSTHRTFGPDGTGNMKQTELDKLLETVDNATILSIDIWGEVNESMIKLRAAWFEIGIELKVDKAFLEELDDKNLKPERALIRTLGRWLEHYDEAKLGGKPTWRMLARIAGKRQMDVAREIARNHPTI